MEKSSGLEREVSLNTDIRDFLRVNYPPTRVASLLKRIRKYEVAKSLGDLISLPHSKILMFQYSGMQTIQELNGVLREYGLPNVNIHQDAYYGGSGQLKYREIQKVRLEKEELFRKLGADKEGRMVDGNYVKGFRVC